MFNIFAKLYNLFSGVSEIKRTFRNIKKNNNWICMEDAGYVADDEKSPKSGDEVMGGVVMEDKVMGGVVMEDKVMGGEVMEDEDTVMVDGLELILLKALKL